MYPIVSEIYYNNVIIDCSQAGWTVQLNYISTYVTESLRFLVPACDSIIS